MNNYLSEIIIKESEINEYPFNLPLFKSGLDLKLNQPITFITGENGSGKSTLLEAIAAKIGFNTLGGNQNHFYKSESIKDNSSLVKDMKLIWHLKTNSGFFFRAESYFNFITYVDDLAKDEGKWVYKPYGGKSLQNQSHGESFFSLFQNRFNNGIFILDEPEAALSPNKQLALISVLLELTNNKNCQFIIATHSPILIACPNSETYEIKNGKLEKTDYKQTEQFQFYKNFINCPERYLKYLCDKNIKD